MDGALDAPPPARTMPEPPPANMAWVCQSWCHYNPDANCHRQDCFGCEECPAPEKWWDRSNNYHGESCLIWGIQENHDTFAHDQIRYSAYCSIERPVCNGHDCHPDSGNPNWWDPESFWCGRNHEPTALTEPNMWAMMVHDSVIESCCVDGNIIGVDGYQWRGGKAIRSRLQISF